MNFERRDAIAVEQDREAYLICKPGKHSADLLPEMLFRAGRSILGDDYAREKKYCNNLRIRPSGRQVSANSSSPVAPSKPENRVPLEVAIL